MKGLYKVGVACVSIALVGCSTASKEHSARNIQTGAAIAAVGNTPGAGVVGIAAALYDFLREKPVFKRTEGMNTVILKRVPGFPGFYKRALDKFKSGDLMGDGAVKLAHEEAYSAGKPLYLGYSEGDEKSVVFAFSNASNVVKVMTPTEADAEKTAKGNYSMVR